MAGRLLLILPLGPHDGPDGRGREDNEEKIHVHGLHNVSTSTSRRFTTARSTPRGSLRSGLQRAGLEPEFDKGAEPRITRIAASLQQRLTVLLG